MTFIRHIQIVQLMIIHLMCIDDNIACPKCVRVVSVFDNVHDHLEKTDLEQGYI